MDINAKQYLKLKAKFESTRMDLLLKFAELVKKDFLKISKKYKEAFPHGLYWIQGTPSFNDGEPCKFFISIDYCTDETAEYYYPNKVPKELEVYFKDLRRFLKDNQQMLQSLSPNSSLKVSFIDDMILWDFNYDLGYQLMENLIKALQIFLKYGNPDWPTRCEHDVLIVCIDPDLVSNEDKETLNDLGFFVDDECFQSFKFGSC